MQEIKEFKDHEFLLRAVWPANKVPNFWRKDGRISSAALKDKNGLSVERTYDRPLKEAVNTMKGNFRGAIISLTVPDCNRVHAFLKHFPSKQSYYHSEIHGSENEVELNDKQAFILSNLAKIRYMPNSQYQI